MIKKIKKPLYSRTIKRKLLEYFRLNLNVDKVKLWDNYLSTIGVNHKLNYVLRYIVDNLILTLNGSTYIIKINKNLQLDNYNLDELARLIDKGNMEIKGTNLFTDGFEYLRNEVQ